MLLVKKNFQILCTGSKVPLHCKYIRPDYDGTLAIHSSSTMIPCTNWLQCNIWKFLIPNSITQDQQEGKNTIFKIVEGTVDHSRTCDQKERAEYNIQNRKDYCLGS